MNRFSEFLRIFFYQSLVIKCTLMQFDAFSSFVFCLTVAHFLLWLLVIVQTGLRNSIVVFSFYFVLCLNDFIHRFV
jgi:hypothetical protein